MTDPMITLDRVTKRFAAEGSAAVNDLSLTVDEGETVVLVGPSGCGKTTTMKMINRLIDPSSGRIVVEGRDVMQQDPVALRRRIGYVIQSIGLMPHRTVRQNIGTVPGLLGWSRDRVTGRIEELAAMVGLEQELLERYPGELSGGQRQRVGVARALAADPPVMLMDEPFGAVDPIVRERLQDEFLRIQRDLRKTIVFVTHDVDEAIKMADRIAILNVGGVLEQYATPDEILRSPANAFVERFVGPERGLKRLSLVSVSDVELERGPVLVRGTAPQESADAASGSEWLVVVDDDGRLLGWEWVDEYGSEGATPRPFGARVTAASTLRQALDAIVTSETNVAAVVEEDGTYRGLLRLERLTREMT